MRAAATSAHAGAIAAEERMVLRCQCWSPPPAVEQAGEKFWPCDQIGAKLPLLLGMVVKKPYDGVTTMSEVSHPPKWPVGGG